MTKLNAPIEKSRSPWDLFKKKIKSKQKAHQRISKKGTPFFAGKGNDKKEIYPKIISEEVVSRKNYGDKEPNLYKLMIDSGNGIPYLSYISAGEYKILKKKIELLNKGCDKKDIDEFEDIVSSYHFDEGMITESEAHQGGEN